MKNSARARSVTVKIDRRMFSVAWANRLLEMLLGVATARIQNG
jgi:hypothetical protein